MFSKDNLILTTRIKAKSGHEDEMRSVLEEGIRRCAGQEGLIIYNLQQDKDDPTLFLFYGHFTSEASYRMHMDSEPVRRIYDEVVLLAEGTPQTRLWIMLEKVE
ncbi:antibiotic biosynthesis monooxygenase family protein [Maridesulfovibrio sp.]|jgi:quinol monooxygenase YgiN|uniref:putative quinol monooxygenase n=1 Tax=Maridesulfovibrio sp. TaxID=2795000 RepID=UPI0029C9D1FA|nr:antibiotic biosynthesis monooxygenase family protein [Maridesulfovibrio sp.]